MKCKPYFAKDNEIMKNRHGFSHLFLDLCFCNERDEMHRDNKPATIGLDGSLYYAQNGAFHSRLGPAVMYNKIEHYYLDGVEYNKANWKRKVNEL